MTREEEIKQAAENYAASVCKDCAAIFYCKERIRKCDEYREQVTVYADAAMWADEHPKNVWHDPDEEPKDAKDLLLIDEKGCAWVGYVSHTNGAPRWKTYVQKGKVAKWAYITDLLPKRGEQ